MMSIDFTLLGFIFSMIALSPIALYFFHRYRYSAKLFFIVGGEQSGEPITLPKEGDVMFAVSTKSRHRVFISEVWVYFNPKEVDLLKTKGAEKRTTAEQNFPFALFFSGTRVVKDKIMLGFFCEHKAIGQKFSLKLITYGQIDETEIKFHDMFPARKFRVERLVKFEVQENYQKNLKESGLALKGGESLKIEGVQSEGAVSVVAEEPTQMQVLEMLKNS